MQTALSLSKILDLVTFPGYRWLVHDGERLYLQAAFLAPDCHTGALAEQFTRKWYISHEATRSEVVQTALKCVLTSVEHEARENFKYRGFAIFGPHLDCEKLVEIHRSNQALDERTT